MANAEMSYATVQSNDLIVVEEELRLLHSHSVNLEDAIGVIRKRLIAVSPIVAEVTAVGVLPSENEAASPLAMELHRINRRLIQMWEDLTTITNRVDLPGQVEVGDA